MKKIPTLFEREFDERGRIKRVLETPKPWFEWVFDGEGVATEKVDGACCAIIGGKFYKRFDAKEDDTQEVCDECAYDVIIADKSAKSGIASVCVCGLMNRAADAIEELSKRVDESIPKDDAKIIIAEVAKPRWIPVEEQLPECDLGAEVGNIEWISCGMVHAGCFGRGGKYRDAYFRTWTDAGEGMDAKDADYWRAVTLPEPPEEE